MKNTDLKSFMIITKANEKLGNINFIPMITGSGGLTLAKHLGIDFVQGYGLTETSPVIAAETDKEKALY